MKKPGKISIIFTILIVLFAIFSPNLMGQKNTAEAYCLDGYAGCFGGCSLVATGFCAGMSLLLGMNVPICIMTSSGGAGSGNDFGSVPGIGITCIDASFGINPVVNFAICESITLTLCGIKCVNQTKVPCVCTLDKNNPPSGTMCSGDKDNLPNSRLSDSNLPWIRVGNYSSNCTSRKCEYYTPPASYSCGGTIPAGSTMCAGDNTGLTANGTWHNVSACGTSKCEYTTPASVCGGSLPAGSLMCSGDGMGPGNWHNVGSCSSANCEYTTPASVCGGAIPVGGIACSGDGTGPGTWMQVPTCSAARCEYIIPTIPSGGDNNGEWMEVRPN